MGYTYLTINKLLFNRNKHTETCFEILSLTLDPPFVGFDYENINL